MNKEKIVLDFAVFALMEIEELCSHVTNFFGQTYKYDPFSDKKIYDYEDFVRQDIITSQIILNQEFNSDIKSLNDLLNNEEITNLLNYLNEEFTEGFPDGDGFGCSSNLDFKTDDLHLLFDKYLELRKFNQNVFITYFIQLINKLQYEESIKNVDLEIKNILNNEKSKKSLKLNIEKDYIESKKNEYLKNLIEKNQYQLKGFITENEINIDFDESLLSCLEFFNNENFGNIKYSAYYNSEFEYSFDYLIHQFLDNKLSNTNEINYTEKNIEYDNQDNFFKIGLLIANSKLILNENYKGNQSSFVYLNLDYTSANSVAEVIASNTGIKKSTIRPIISATISNSNIPYDNKNIFYYKRIKTIDSLYNYCIFNKIEVSEYFIKKYTEQKKKSEQN